MVDGEIDLDKAADPSAEVGTIGIDSTDVEKDLTAWLLAHGYDPETGKISKPAPKDGVPKTIFDEKPSTGDSEGGGSPYRYFVRKPYERKMAATKVPKEGEVVIPDDRVYHYAGADDTVIERYRTGIRARKKDGRDLTYYFAGAQKYMSEDIFDKQQEELLNKYEKNKYVAGDETGHAYHFIGSDEHAKLDQSEVVATKVGRRPTIKSTFLRELLTWVIILALAYLLARVVTDYIIVKAEVPTGSMENTIIPDDRILGLRIAYMFSKPGRGDVMIFLYPDDEEQDFVKRVIGLPGETVEIIDNVVYIDGKVLEEPYLKEPMYSRDFSEKTGNAFHVPEDSYLMLGDNRNDSKDARMWANKYLSEDKIVGKVVLRYKRAGKPFGFGWIK